ncbi:hypothetical protein RZS08_05105, partial [Arthrospira platensis SPKY1]|nr:hypothetical protein [Arthrospira platensis SPKY1]
MKNQNDEHRESDDFTLNPLVFRGLQSVAHYRETGNKVYDDNPLICALPGIMDPKEFFERTTYLPIYDESDRQLPSMERLHLLMEATRFF